MMDKLGDTPENQAQTKASWWEDRLENDFSYHKPFGDQPKRYEDLRWEGKEFAKLIVSLCPDSRERSVALTKLEEVVFWANAAIARNENEIQEKKAV